MDQVERMTLDRVTRVRYSGMNILTHILTENDHGVTLHLLHVAAQVMASLKWPYWHMDSSPSFRLLLWALPLLHHQWDGH